MKQSAVKEVYLSFIVRNILVYNLATESTVLYYKQETKVLIFFICSVGLVYIQGQLLVYFWEDICFPNGKMIQILKDKVENWFWNTPL